MNIDTTRLVPFDGRDFAVFAHKRGQIIPGHRFRFYSETTYEFEAITADTEWSSFGRVRVRDTRTGETHVVHPAKVGLSVAAYVDAVHESPRPRGGDAVRLAQPWAWAGDMVKLGATGVLDGHVDRESDGGMITFHPSTHRDRKSGWVSCSGGPATIHTPAAELRPTTDTTVLSAWDWGRNVFSADKSVSYFARVRVWDWIPND